MKRILIILALSFFSLLGGAQGIWYVPADTLVMDNDSLRGLQDKYFDSDREILRSWEPGVIIGGDKLQDMLEWMYYVNPTINISIFPTTVLYEVGISQLITIYVTINNPAGVGLDNGYVYFTAGSTDPIGGLFSGDVTRSFTFNPSQGSSADYTLLNYSFQGQVEYSGLEDTAYIYSNTISVAGKYPIFYGTYPDVSLSSATGTTIYSLVGRDLTKSVTSQGTKSVTFNSGGATEYAYIFIPSDSQGSWSDTTFSLIKDANQLDATTGFTSSHVRVTSLSLTDNYADVKYRCYRITTPSAFSNQTYTFIP